MSASFSDLDDPKLRRPARISAAGPGAEALLSAESGAGAEPSRLFGGISRPGSRLRPLTLALLLLALDFFLVALLAAISLNAAAPSRSGTPGWSGGDWLLFALAPCAMTFSLWRQGAYAIDRAGARLSTMAIGCLNGCGLLVLGFCVLAAFSAGHGPAHGSAAELGLVVSIGIAMLGRNAVWLLCRPQIVPRLAKTPVAVAGSVHNVGAFLEALRQGSETTRVVAVFDLDGRIDELVTLVRNRLVRTVFIALAPGEIGSGVSLLAKLALYPVAVRIVPDFGAVAARSHGVSLVAGLPAYDAADPPLAGAAAALKRAEDLVLGALLVLIAAPVMLAASIAIKLESRGPVLFRQPRHGLGGAEFQVFKFRTMYSQCEDLLATRQTSRRDPRVTRVGAFLRRHSLDELPQLFNVLFGTMSLVGPRPHAPATSAGGQSLDRAVVNYMARHRVKPGITGLAQISGCRGNLDTVEKAVRRVEFDLSYIEKWSLMLDLQILLKTVGLVLHDDAAF